MKKILIVDDHEIIRDSLRLILEKDFEVYSAASGQESQIILKEVSPDLIIIDLSLPDTTGVEIAEYARKTFPKIYIVILTAVEDSILIKALYKTADCYLFKSMEGINSIAMKIEELIRTGKTDTRGYITKLLLEIKEWFSESEAKVFALMKKGSSSVQIAEGLFLSINTVNNYRKSVLRKLGLKNTIQLITKY